jgi:lauroyl/myristoyl acyltransferase
MKASGFSSIYYRLISLCVKLARSGESVELISNAVSSFRGAVSSSRNNLYAAHLKRMFPDKNSIWIRNTLAAYWKVHERNLFALFYMMNKGPENLPAMVSWTGREHLDSALKKGKGVLLLVPHFGDERSLHVILGMAGYAVDVITSRYSDMPEYAAKCRLRIGEKWNTLHFPGESPRWMFDTLQSGRIIHYASTAYGGPGGTWVTNFGVPVLVPSAPWKLHRRTGCEILMASCAHTAGMGFNLRFMPLYPSSDSSTEFAEAFAGATENLALEYPSQYEWKNLLIRHRETNTIRRTGRIPEDESELERLAIPEDSDPALIRPEAVCLKP